MLGEQTSESPALLEAIDKAFEPTPEQLSLYGRAFQEYGALIVRWAPETRAILVMEFITQKQLYPELNAFLRKKIR